MQKAAVEITVVVESTETLVVTPDGEMDMFLAPSLRQELWETLGQPHCKTVLLDLSRCISVDSVICGLFVETTRHAQEHQQAFILLSPNAAIRRLFSITRLDRILTIQTSE
jgi:anti-anti-sigma factor